MHVLRAVLHMSQDRAGGMAGGGVFVLVSVHCVVCDICRLGLQTRCVCVAEKRVVLSWRGD